MRLLGIGVALVGIAACFSKPVFQGAPDDGRAGEAGGEAGVPGALPSVTSSGLGVADPITITTPDLVMVIPQGTVGMPSSLKIDDTEVLGRAGTCGDEDRVGVAVYPAISVTANAALWPVAGMAPTSTPSVTDVGPAFVHVSLSWSNGQYTCGGTQTASGLTAFTVFPDGRIIRDDRILPVTTGLPLEGGPSMPCGCNNSTFGYFLTSFISLDNTAFSRAVYENQSSAITVDPLTDITEDAATDDDNPEWACFEKSTTGTPVRRVGVVWTQPLATQNNGTRMKRNNDSVTTLIYDWIHGGNTVAMGTYTTQTAWFVDGGSDATCDATVMNALRRSFTSPRRMDIGTTSARGTVITLDPSTGIYHSTQSTASPTWHVGVETGAIDGVPAGFALSLRFPTSVQPRVTRDGVALIDGTDYRYQKTTGATPVTHSWWFAAALGKDAVLGFDQP
ncbi:hypothetical protein BH11MYX3_BH11MYX3_10170 [soil metagenome]